MRTITTKINTAIYIFTINWLNKRKDQGVNDMNKKQRLIAAAIIICIFVIFQYFKLKPYYFEQNFSDVGRTPLEEMDSVDSYNLSESTSTGESSESFHYNESGKQEMITLLKQITVLKVQEEQIPELVPQHSVLFSHPVYASKNFWFDIGKDINTGKEYI